MLIQNPDIASSRDGSQRTNGTFNLLPKPTSAALGARRVQGVTAAAIVDSMAPSAVRGHPPHGAARDAAAEP